MARDATTADTLNLSHAAYRSARAKPQRGPSRPGSGSDFHVWVSRVRIRSPVRETRNANHERIESITANRVQKMTVKASSAFICHELMRAEK